MSIEVNLNEQEYADQGAEVRSADDQVREAESHAQAFAGQDLEPPVIPKQLRANRDDGALAERPSGAVENDTSRSAAPVTAEVMDMNGRVVGVKVEAAEASEPDSDAEDAKDPAPADAAEDGITSPYYAFLDSHGEAGKALEPYLKQLAITKDDYCDRVRDRGGDDGDELDSGLLDRLGHDNGAQGNSRVSQLTDILGRSLQELQDRPELVADGKVNWLGLSTGLLDKAAALDKDPDPTERHGLLVSATTAALMAEQPEDRLVFLERTAAHGLGEHMEKALDKSDVTIILGGYRNGDVRSISGNEDERTIRRMNRFSDAFLSSSEDIARYRQLVERDIDPQGDAHIAMKAAMDDYSTADGVLHGGHAAKLEEASVTPSYVDKYRIDPTKAERFALEEEFVRAQMDELFPDGDTSNVQTRLATERPNDPDLDADTGLWKLRSHATQAIEDLSKPVTERFEVPDGDPTDTWTREQLVAWRYQQLVNTGASYQNIAKFVDTSIAGVIGNLQADVHTISQDGAALPAVATETVRVVLDMAKNYTEATGDTVSPDELRDLTQANRRQLMKLAAINIDHLSASLISGRLRNQGLYSREEPSETTTTMFRKPDGSLALDGPIFQPAKASSQSATRLACVALRVNVEGRPEDADTMVRGKTNSVELLAGLVIDEAYDRGIFEAGVKEMQVNQRLLTPAQESEFTRMYVQYHEFLVGVVKRTGISEQDAEDVLQETYLAAARSRSGRIFDPESDDNEKAYLARVAQNTAINRYRQAQRRPKTTTDPEANELGLLNAMHPGPSTEQLVASNDVRERLFTEWKSLMPERHFQILILNGYYGMQYKDIADTLNIPIGTVMSSLNRAKNAIREHEKQKALQP